MFHNCTNMSDCVRITLKDGEKQVCLSKSDFVKFIAKQNKNTKAFEVFQDTRPTLWYIYLLSLLFSAQIVMKAVKTFTVQ